VRACPRSTAMAHDKMDEALLPASAQEPRMCPSRSGAANLRRLLSTLIFLAAIFLVGSRWLNLFSAAEASQYTHVQYLGFSLFTVPGTAADGCFGQNRSTMAKCFLGSTDVEEDLEARMRVMNTAIESAHASANWDRSNATLKIFMAPEFFWRGPQGAYPMTPEFATAVRRIIGDLEQRLGSDRFQDWLFVLGTVIAVRVDQEDWVATGNSEDKDEESRMSYFNFAPVQIGGTSTMKIQFKHYISTLDFPDTTSREGAPPPVPRPTKRPECFVQRSFTEDCRLRYGEMTADDVRHEVGFKDASVLVDGVFDVKGLTIGLEICLDHMLGRLVADLGPRKFVDVHLISSAGMNIAGGPVATNQGNPIFLADGFGRTAMSLNIYGRGREANKLLTGRFHYDVGVVYGADSNVELGQWASSIIAAFAGNNPGAARIAGMGTLPGGYQGNAAGFEFTQINALGKDWLTMLEGFFDTASYKEALRIFSLVGADVNRRVKKEHRHLFNNLPDGSAYFPTIDMYGPIPVNGKWT